MTSRARYMVDRCRNNVEHQRADVSSSLKECVPSESQLEEVFGTCSSALLSNACNTVRISEAFSESPGPSKEYHLLTPLVENHINLIPAVEELPPSPQSPFPSDHSEYVPEDVSTSSDSDSLPLSRLRSLVRENNLEGMQTFPQVTSQSRKRLLSPTKWKRNIAREKRARGEQYVSSRNRNVPAVNMNPPCPDSCRKKCFSKLKYEERLQIFKSYWNLANYSRQRDFIQSNTNKKETRTKTAGENSKRSASITFFLPINGEKMSVCKTMFINTLGIKKGVVDIALKKRTLENTTTVDKRGKHVKKVTSIDVLEDMKRHIESFPSVPSHYCRSGTKRQYLCSTLNITLMYKLYCIWCDDRNVEKASEAMYRKCFNENYNLGFHRPRKDQCRICMSFHNASAAEKKSSETTYNAHLRIKELARAEKRSDKAIAEESNGELICANFDLQQVLLVPTDPTNNALFYKRRLATYNFTVYNVVNKQGDCFMWTETEGKRGSCEIGSCVYKYLKSLPISTKQVTFYSDRCGGQKLNKFMAAMCLLAVQEIDNITRIDLKFLVSGHSEMECDSMHAAISREFKRIGKALWPEDWKTIARSARRKGDRPYIVHDLKQDDIFDYKKFVEQNMSIRKTDESGGPVNWQKMCWMRYNKALPFIMEFKEAFDGEFKLLNFNKKTRRSSHLATSLQPLYKDSIPITEQKYSNLASLFEMKPPALGDAYKPFYYSLPHNNKVSDVLSDIEEETTED